MSCKPSNLLGRLCVFEYALGCGNALPAPGDWKRMGGMVSKSLSAGWDTIDVTDDDTVGYVRSNMATWMTFEVSGNGNLKTDDTQDAANFKELYKHFFNPASTGGQPYVWVRLTAPGFLRFTAFCLLSELPLEFPEDQSTYSITATAAASQFGVMVEDAPTPVPVTSLTVTPTTLALEVAEDSAPLVVAALPVGAPQTYTMYSDNGAVATVNPSTGVVTGVSVGTANIVATSTADATKKATCVVTVSA